MLIHGESTKKMGAPIKPSRGVVTMAASFVAGLVLSVVFINQVHKRTLVENSVLPLPTLVNTSTVVAGIDIAGPSTPLEPGGVNGDVSLLILIYSTNEKAGEKLREAIRNSWLTDISNHEYRFVIPVGEAAVSVSSSLVLEQQQYEDLLFIAEAFTPFVSSRQLMVGLEWAMTKQFTLLLKVNHASFVDINNLLRVVVTVNSPYLLWGYFRGNEEIRRTGPHSEKEWNLCQTFLPFPEGGGYIVSRNVIEMITTLGPNLQHMDNDDGAIGVWTAPYDHIKRQHDTRFNTGLQSRGCNNKYLITHPETAESMVAKYDLLIAKNVSCESEEKIIGGYEYNWNVPMKQCCKESKDIP